MRMQESTSSNDDNDNNVSSTSINPNLYRSISLLHLTQILLAYKKSGLTLTFLNAIGGPVMAVGILLLLSQQQRQRDLIGTITQQGHDTFQRLNGLLVLYSTLLLGLIALVPKQLSSPFGKLWVLSALGTLSVCIQGYLKGLYQFNGVAVEATGKEKWEVFTKDTDRLLTDAAGITFRLPKMTGYKQSEEDCDDNVANVSIGSFLTLWTIAILKASLLLGVVNVLKTQFVVGMIASKLSQLCRLTILGGSMVIANSIPNSLRYTKGQQRLTFSMLNVFSSYILGTISAFTISQASSKLEMGKGCWLGVCAISTFMNGTKPRLMTDGDNMKKTD